MLSLADRKRHPHIKYISGEITGSTIIATDKGDKRFRSRCFTDYFAINNLTIKRGRSLTQSHMEMRVRAGIG